MNPSHLLNKSLFCAAMVLCATTPDAVDAARRDPTVSQDCGCPGQRFPMENASIAFKGTLTHISETTKEVRGFPFEFIDLTFRIETLWRGLPDDITEFTIRTDSTSCGYGRIFAPDGRANIIGGTFGVFASDPFLSVCDSVVVDETWFPKNKNPFVSDANQPKKPASAWDKTYPDGWIDLQEKESERMEKEREEAPSDFDPRARSPEQQYNRVNPQ